VTCFWTCRCTATANPAGHTSAARHLHLLTMHGIDPRNIEAPGQAAQQARTIVSISEHAQLKPQGLAASSAPISRTQDARRSSVAHYAWCLARGRTIVLRHRETAPAGHLPPDAYLLSPAGATRLSACRSRGHLPLHDGTLCSVVLRAVSYHRPHDGGFAVGSQQRRH